MNWAIGMRVGPRDRGTRQGGPLPYLASSVYLEHYLQLVAGACLRPSSTRHGSVIHLQCLPRAEDQKLSMPDSVLPSVI